MKTSFKIIAAFVALLLINGLLYWKSPRFDLTEGKMYTLSDTTVNVLSNLKKDVIIQAYVSGDLPPQAEIIRRDLSDYLDEYKAYGGSRLSILQGDPIADTKLQEQTSFFQIQELNLQVFQNDKRSTQKAYLGLAIYTKKAPTEKKADDQAAPSFGEQVDIFETIPVIQNFTDFEFDLTTAIKKVSDIERKKVAFLSGHDEHKLASEMAAQMMQSTEPRADFFYEEQLQKIYETETLTLTKEKSKIEGIQTLVVAGPKKNLEEFEVSAIKEFIKSGGNVIFLIDGIDVEENGASAKVSEADFSPLLSDWGIGIEKKLISDKSSAEATFRQGFFQFQVPYSLWPRIVNFSQDSAITAKMDALVLPWASPLKVEKKDGVSVKTLATSSPYYNLQEKDFVMSPNEKEEFKSNSEPKKFAVVAQKGQEGKLLVVSDSDFPAIQFARQFPSNARFFLNMIDSFTLGDEIISIRSREPAQRFIDPDLTDWQKQLARWGNIFIVPLVFVGYGLFRRSIRKTKKKALMSA